MNARAEAVSLDKLRRQLATVAAKVQAGHDPDALHQLRTTLARINVWLRLGEYGVLLDDVRWLRSAAAPLRDAHVQSRLVPSRDPQHARFQAAAYRDLVELIASDRAQSLLQALASLPALPRQQLETTIRKWAERLRKRTRISTKDDDDLAALHALRRRVRRLRYALEFAGTPVEEIVQLQTALGDTRDLTLALDDPKLKSTRRTQLVKERDAHLRKAKDAYHSLRPRLRQLAP